MSESSILSLAVVGHTNTGKTSLLRTLARDAAFGEVADAPATTRQVEGMALAVDGEDCIELYDTPGLEQAGEVYEWLQEAGSGRHDGPDRVRAFLEQAASGPLEQEGLVLRQVLECRAGLYVIDAREPVLEKYQDELAVLAMTGRPVLPVLNFVAASGARSEDWQAALARVNLHAVARFDTVVFDPRAEARLWRALAGLVPEHEALLDALIAERGQDLDWRRGAACRRAAEFLVDAASDREYVDRDDPEATGSGRDRLMERIGAAEHACLADLLELFRFDPEAGKLDALPGNDGAGPANPFDGAGLQRLGLTSGKYAGSGLAAGAAFDISTGGLSLGAGSLVGALAGAGLGGIQGLRHSIRDRISRRLALALDEPLLRLLLVRQKRVLAHLFRRGHAAVDPLALDDAVARAVADESLPRPLVRARARPEWHGLATGRHAGRDGSVQSLADHLVPGQGSAAAGR